MTGGRGYGARPAYEAVATKGDATASYLWCGGSDPGSLGRHAVRGGGRVAVPRVATARGGV